MPPMSSTDLREAFPSQTLVIGDDFELPMPPLDGLHRPIKKIDTIPGVEVIIGAENIVVNVRGTMQEIFDTLVPRIQGKLYQFIKQTEEGQIEREYVQG